MCARHTVRPRVLLFDWIPDGHHQNYLELVAAALRDSAEIVIAGPESIRGQIASHADEFFSLGADRPAAGGLGQPSFAEVAAAEVPVFRSAIAATGASHAIHLYADDLVPYLAEAPPMCAHVSLLLFRYHLHYPFAFRNLLLPQEWLEALRTERALQRWRTRSDAGALLFFDEVAARFQSRRRGARAVWLPEAPVPRRPVEAGSNWSERQGCVLIGALAWRKGLHSLARAVELFPTDMRVRVAGQPAPGFESELQRHVDSMRAAGATVDVRAEWLSEASYLGLIASARCAVVAYPRHFGSSRVLLEAAAMGTPTVADSFGYVGYLVRHYGLGRSVRSADSKALRKALDGFITTRASCSPELTARLRDFADRYTSTGFAAAWRAVLC